MSRQFLECRPQVQGLCAKATVRCLVYWFPGQSPYNLQGHQHVDNDLDMESVVTRPSASVVDCVYNDCQRSKFNLG